ncbi:MAG: protoporphyrinogen oxidase [Cytophagales bacterium]|nr:MAG: protoporphyrinogen oxidase [Cytophagales bacterium]TAF62353.1 MAG: protoporphyrinogen oxidase [Cytophagales bacterium]
MGSVIVIGAGISGLSAAYALQQKGHKVLVLESSQKAGGLIQTLYKDDFRLELGPNSILASAELVQWLEGLGLMTEAEEASPVSKDRFIYRNGQVRALPSNPLDLLKNDFFSFKTKLLLAREPFRKAENIPNETISEFFLRRFNQEVLDYAVRPFVGGIYAGNPDKLLLKYNFPALVEMEQKHGSIIKGLAKTSALARRRSFNFKNGMAALPQALAKQLDIRFDSPVLAISGERGAWRVHTQEQIWETQKIVLASPAKAVASFLPPELAVLTAELSRVPYAAMHVVHTAFKKSAFKALPSGFGVLHPACEKQFSSGNIWTSSVFPHSAPSELVLFTSFVGGMQQPERTLLSAEAIKQGVSSELEQHYQPREAPLWQNHVFWPEAIPQYTSQMQELEIAVQKIQEAGLLICTNWYGGSSLFDCITKGIELAKK